jgi:hypothetical protein
MEMETETEMETAIKGSRMAVDAAGGCADDRCTMQTEGNTQSGLESVDRVQQPRTLMTAFLEGASGALILGSTVASEALLASDVWTIASDGALVTDDETPATSGSTWSGVLIATNRPLFWQRLIDAAAETSLPPMGTDVRTSDVRTCVPRAAAMRLFLPGAALVLIDVGCTSTLTELHAVPMPKAAMLVVVLGPGPGVEATVAAARLVTRRASPLHGNTVPGVHHNPYGAQQRRPLLDHLTDILRDLVIMPVGDQFPSAQHTVLSLRTPYPTVVAGQDVQQWLALLCMEATRVDLVARICGALCRRGLRVLLLTHDVRSQEGLQRALWRTPHCVGPGRWTSRDRLPTVRAVSLRRAAEQGAAVHPPTAALVNSIYDCSSGGAVQCVISTPDLLRQYGINSLQAPWVVVEHGAALAEENALLAANLAPVHARCSTVNSPDSTQVNCHLQPFSAIATAVQAVCLDTRDTNGPPGACAAGPRVFAPALVDLLRTVHNFEQRQATLDSHEPSRHDHRAPLRADASMSGQVTAAVAAIMASLPPGYTEAT